MTRLQPYLAVRQYDGGDANDTTLVCQTTAPDSSDFPLRIGSIFIILASSMIGALLPIILARTSKFRTPGVFFFIVKYFGTGVILATAFMHLLAPAIEELGNPCLAAQLGDYPWALAISLMTIMAMFLVELVISNFDLSGGGHDHGHSHSHSHGQSQSQSHNHGHGHGHGHGHDQSPERSEAQSIRQESSLADGQKQDLEAASALGLDKVDSHKAAAAPKQGGIMDGAMFAGEDHLAHNRDHVEGDSYMDFSAQLTAIAILEFGVVLHSVFIGLTLAVTDNFVILLVVLTFHQMFEGLGLGARLASAEWPPYRRWWPYYLGVAFGISTPLSIAIGLGVRQSLALEATQSLIVNGVLDAISSGILIYTALVELLAHEFMFNPEMRKAGLKMQLQAYSCVAVGLALMALLAKWA